MKFRPTLKLKREFKTLVFDFLKIFETPPCASYSKDNFTFLLTGILTSIP